MRTTTWNRESVRSELQRIHATGEQMAHQPMQSAHGALYQAASKLYRKDGGYAAALRDAGIPVAFTIRTSERVLYGRERNYFTTCKGLKSFLALCPVGLMITNGDGIVLARTDSERWECRVYDKSLSATDPGTAARWIVSHATPRSVLEWTKATGA